MAKKPLKLKRYVTENEAAQLLSALINEDVTPDEMHEYACAGVVPAYIKFSPQDRSKHPGSCFGLISAEYFLPVVRNHFRGFVDEETTKADRALIQELGSHDFEPCYQLLPFPLLGGSYVSATNGRWRVFVEQENGCVEPVSAEHYVRMYSPPEICQAARLMNDPCLCPEWPAVLHTHGTVYEDEFDEYEPFEWDSPFNQQLHFSIQSRDSEDLRPTKMDRRINWPLVVAGLRELLGPEWQKQEAIAGAIGEREWKGARRDDVKHALRKANQAKEALNQ